MPKEKLFIYSHTKGNVDYYDVNPKVDVFIPAISLNTGCIRKKKIIGYTFHKDLEMYKIHDRKNRFKDFWVSEDHSLIVFNYDNGNYEKISPLEIMEQYHKYALVRKMNGGNREFIDCIEIEISYDPNVREAGDFTVEDFYTFCNDDGIFLQDSMALYRPLTSNAIKECETKMWTYSKNNVFSSANGTVQFKPEQAIVYGIYKMTSTEKGRKVFTKMTSTKIDGNNPVDSKKLQQIITDECKRGNIEILDKIKNIGFSYILNNSETMSILDLEPMEINLTGDKNHDSDELEKITNKIKNEFPKADIINSGARASWDQVRQMIGARGYVSDFYGNIINIPVKKPYAEGLTPEDYFVSCYGARKGILDVAENTAKSGYLTRKMVYSAVNMELDKNTEDCGTNLCLRLENIDKDLAKSLIGRYYYLEGSDELKCVEDPNDILNKTILLRSPIFCKNPKVCKTCYGKHADIVNTKFIGVVAAQSIGERSTQLVLRTFHTGGVAQSKNLDEQHDIVSTINTIDTLDKTLDMESMEDVTDYTLSLFNLFKEYGYIYLVHFEVIIAQRLWIELDDKFIRYRTNQDKLKEYETYSDDGKIIDFDYKIKLISIKNIPSMESWFLGMAFQNARSNFIKGLIHPSKRANILERIILGQL